MFGRFVLRFGALADWFGRKLALFEATSGPLNAPPGLSGDHENRFVSQLSWAKSLRGLTGQRL